MKGSRFTEEQVLTALQQQESRQKTVEAVCHELGVSQSTFFKWKKKYGGMSLSEVKRLRILEKENARLKRLLSERTLELDALNEALKKI
jgi:putative transposase